jgi:threonine synthase
VTCLTTHLSWYLAVVATAAAVTTTTSTITTASHGATTATFAAPKGRINTDLLVLFLRLNMSLDREQL